MSWEARILQAVLGECGNTAEPTQETEEAAPEI